MYLITTINAELEGFDIVTKGTRKKCESSFDELQSLASRDIFSDTRYKNAKILTNKEALKLFGKRGLEYAEEAMFELYYPEY